MIHETNASITDNSAGRRENKISAQLSHATQRSDNEGRDERHVQDCLAWYAYRSLENRHAQSGVFLNL